MLVEVDAGPACDLAGRVMAGLEPFPELIPEAIANARAMILRGDLGGRAQRGSINGCVSNN
jgi:hypothetical protein